MGHGVPPCGAFGGHGELPPELPLLELPPPELLPLLELPVPELLALLELVPPELLPLPELPELPLDVPELLLVVPELLVPELAELGLPELLPELPLVPELADTDPSPPAPPSPDSEMVNTCPPHADIAASPRTRNSLKRIGASAQRKSDASTH